MPDFSELYGQPWLMNLVAQAHQSLGEIEQGYIRARGVTKDTEQRFLIGSYKEPPKLSECPREFVTWADYGEKLRHCLIFPIFDWVGGLQGIMLRRLDNHQYYPRYDKYLLPETEYIGLFYGGPDSLRAICKAKIAVIVEGIFDFFALFPKIPVIACLTSTITKLQREDLALVCKKWVIALDNDPAGKKGFKSILESVDDDIELLQVSSFYKDWSKDLEKGKLNLDKFRILIPEMS